MNKMNTTRTAFSQIKLFNVYNDQMNNNTTNNNEKNLDVKPTKNIFRQSIISVSNR